MADPRVLRTRAAIHAAVIELAAVSPVSTISVTQLAEAAGINRVTFYKHFASPNDALLAALNAELDPIRDRGVRRRHEANADAREVVVLGLTEMLDHVEQHRMLYRTALSIPNENATHHLLSEHFAESIRGFLADQAPFAPELDLIDREITAQFVGNGLVGAISSWLTREQPTLDRARFLATLTESLPAWWFKQHS
ncbi:TetR/AcrR family transcriptional regulator [Leucobacter sp. M11]|uniref:TetR/AcrR family transcriptional regulator n=1 Tax=Leucobacter sp. M11 TaxID=2993565 RepID=UPI002D7EF803|nr:TetR-like C-terminal domain-containing protein [Leucobacter sp. M11]MEB4615756.1 TetR-like C-terminal domain-containing protein [Leucobacter sp. M11]